MIAPVVAIAFSRVLGGIFGRSAAASAQRTVVTRVIRVLQRGFKRLPKVTGIPNPIEPNLTVDKQIDEKFKLLVKVYISKLLDNIVVDSSRRRNQLINMVIFGAKARRGSAINAKGTTGLVGTDLFRKVRDPSVIGELGFPSRFNPEAKLVKGLRESIRVQIFRPRYDHFVMKFVLDYNRLRNLTPHPAAKMKSGANIRVKSWLDWLHGDAVVTDAGFVSLRQLRGARISRRPLSPRSIRLAGRDAGWMISKKKKISRKGSSNRGTKGKKKESSSVNIPTSWRISKPVDKNWVTEQSRSIGVGLLDLYAGGLIQRIHRRTVKNFTAKV